jgi:hypothetical protein
MVLGHPDIIPRKHFDFDKDDRVELPEIEISPVDRTKIL